MPGPPPASILCHICNGKFFKSSYNIHVKRCKAKYIKQHSKCPKCDRDITNDEYGKHVAGCSYKRPKGAKPVESLSDKLLAERSQAKPDKTVKNSKSQLNTSHARGAKGSRLLNAAPITKKKADVDELNFSPDPFPSEKESNNLNNRVECRTCGRKFVANRVAVHERICGKKKIKRKVWDEEKHRLQGTAFEAYLTYKPPPNPTVVAAREQKKLNWKKMREQFLRAFNIVKKENQEQRIDGTLPFTSKDVPASSLEDSRGSSPPKAPNATQPESRPKSMPGRMTHGSPTKAERPNHKMSVSRQMPQVKASIAPAASFIPTKPSPSSYSRAAQPKPSKRAAKREEAPSGTDKVLCQHCGRRVRPKDQLNHVLKCSNPLTTPFDGAEKKGKEGKGGPGAFLGLQRDPLASASPAKTPGKQSEKTKDRVEDSWTASKGMAEYVAREEARRKRARQAGANDASKQQQRGSQARPSTSTGRRKRAGGSKSGLTNGVVVRKAGKAGKAGRGPGRTRVAGAPEVCLDGGRVGGPTARAARRKQLGSERMKQHRAAFFETRLKQAAKEAEAKKHARTGSQRPSTAAGSGSGTFMQGQQHSIYGNLGE